MSHSPRRNPTSMMSDKVKIGNIDDDPDYKRLYSSTRTKTPTISEYTEARELEEVKKEDIKNQWDGGTWIDGSSISSIELKARLHNQRINELKAMRRSMQHPCKFSCGCSVITAREGDIYYKEIGKLQGEIDIENGTVSFHECQSSGSVDADIESLKNQVREMRKWLLDVMIHQRPFLR